MKLSQNNRIRHLLAVFFIGFTLISLGACANVQHQATFNKNYLPKEDVRIKVAKVMNDTGYTFDVDIEQLLTNTLEEQLMHENLLNLGKTEPNLFMESRIVGYKKGSAFKRWMMPGWGATELSIRCDLKDANNNLVGTAMSNREIVAGGLYTVGAWETIFDDVANDVAGDLKHQIVAQGYVIKPKTGSRATTAAKDNEPGASATHQPKQMQGITSTSEIDPTKKAIDKPEEEPKLAAIPKDAPVVRVGLRRQPVLITNQMQIKDMLMEYDFFDQSKNAYGAFVNGFIDNNDGTVTDRATGLMWQKNGSPSRLNNRKAKEYINKLKKQRFAGYSDWRMPTIEELASLLARKSNKGVHIAPEFETHQFSCWSADKCRPLTDYFVGYWIVNFKQGQILESSIQKSSVMPSVRMSGNKNVTNYVKAVRSVR